MVTDSPPSEKLLAACYAANSENKGWKPNSKLGGNYPDTQEQSFCLNIGGGVFYEISMCVRVCVCACTYQKHNNIVTLCIIHLLLYLAQMLYLFTTTR